MAPSKYNDSRIVRRIAQESGLSMSSVYGILNGERGFSDYHRGVVEGLARAYGLVILPQRADRPLTVGVVIPRSPTYFWNEAIAGMKKAMDLHRTRGRQVRAIFRCFSTDLSEEGNAELIDGFRESPCDGYILYPLLGRVMWDFFSELPRDLPILLFNDRPAEVGQQRFFRDRPACAYVGSDNATEGRQAALVLEPYLPEMRSIIALVINRTEQMQTASARIESFSTYAHGINPTVSIETLPLEVASRTSASMLAGELERRMLSGHLDGVYVSAGFTHIAAAAIRKICRKHGVDELSIPCIGHEFSPSDKPYLLDGILRGYVRQDIYRQGQVAMEQILACIEEGRPMKDIVVRSSFYTR